MNSSFDVWLISVLQYSDVTGPCKTFLCCELCISYQHVEMFSNYIANISGWDSIVVIATGYGPEMSGDRIPVQVRSSAPVVGPTLPPREWVLGLFPWGKLIGM